MRKSDSLQSALNVLVLTVLEKRGPLHGYAIATLIEELSEEALRVEEGSLYPALYRMEHSGWIKASWVTTENKRRARVYELTAEGARQLDDETGRWANFSAGVNRVLQVA